MGRDFGVRAGVNSRRFLLLPRDCAMALSAPGSPELQTFQGSEKHKSRDIKFGLVEI
jgi:hypothetical protein